MGTDFLHLMPENGGSRFLRNAGINTKPHDVTL
jgi:hypothetical protein